MRRRCSCPFGLLMLKITFRLDERRCGKKRLTASPMQVNLSRCQQTLGACKWRQSLRLRPRCWQSLRGKDAASAKLNSRSPRWPTWARKDDAPDCAHQDPPSPWRLVVSGQNLGARASEISKVKLAREGAAEVAKHPLCRPLTRARRAALSRQRKLRRY